MDIKPGSIPDAIAESLKANHIIAIYGHGCFATGQLLEEAFGCITAVELACEIFCQLRSMNVRIPPKTEKP
jgi:L-fuculose-phosphate aldolase